MRFRRILTATSSGVSSFLVRVSSRWPTWGNTRGAVAREHAGAGERGRRTDGYRPIVPDPTTADEPRPDTGPSVVVAALGLVGVATQDDAVRVRHRPEVLAGIAAVDHQVGRLTLDDAGTAQPLPRGPGRGTDRLEVAHPRLGQRLDLPCDQPVRQLTTGVGADIHRHAGLTCLGDGLMAPLVEVHHVV